jgi:hypothetical protein
MKIETVSTAAGDFQIWESDGHGRSTGNPGNYNKKTSGIQVREYMPGGGYLLLKTFNFPVSDAVKKKTAIEKAKKYIIEEHA